MNITYEKCGDYLIPNLYSRKLRFAKFIARICPRTPMYLENFFVRGYNT